jgi:hypothetical protein
MADPVVGQLFGKWRVSKLYEQDDGTKWAEIVNTRNPRVQSRCPVTDLERLGGS